MNFRQLIERAMNEARDEFAEIVARKLEALMGTAATGTTRRASPARASKSPSAPREARGATQTRRPAGVQRRAAPEHMATIKEKVLGVMKPGQAIRKGEIMRLAKLPEDEDVRVRLVLARLKASGVVTMKGTRGSAMYVLKGD